jgi:hypothetical protein
MRLKGRAASRVDSEHLLLLKQLLLLAVVGFAFLLAWHYGLLHRVWSDDATGLAVAITLAFLAAAAHGCAHALRLSRALNQLAEIERLLTAPEPAPPPLSAAPAWPAGCVTQYIRSLHLKARLGGIRPVHQGLLLETFEAELRQGHEFGWFVAELLLSLGLLGTVIGFIVMLGPISGLDAGDQSAIKNALAAMSGGMAVALYTTLTGLIGGMLLKVQGFLLDRAVEELIRGVTRLTEVHILPTIEGMPSHAAV